jgi:signal peptidase II
MAWGVKIPGAWKIVFNLFFRVGAVGGIGYWLWDSVKESSII